jgi:hypothetical protein
MKLKFEMRENAGEPTIMAQINQLLNTCGPTVADVDVGDEYEG